MEIKNNIDFPLETVLWSWPGTQTDCYEKVNMKTKAAETILRLERYR